MKTVGKRSLVAFTAAAALLLAGCAGAAPNTAAFGTTTPAPASASSTADAGGTSTSPAPPSDSPSGTPGGEPTVLPTTASVTVFYIAVGDGGFSGPTIGCGDVAVAVTSPAISYTDPVEGALRVLLDDRSGTIGQSGLRNFLSKSRLVIASIERTGTTVTVNLTGTLSMGGVCDIPRVQEQLLLTAQKAAGGPVDIMLNGKTLSEALSVK